MKVIGHDRYGSAEVFELKNIDKPVVKDDEVLARVRAASANPLDWHFMRGQPHIMRDAIRAAQSKEEGPGQRCGRRGRGDRQERDAVSCGR